MELAKEDAAWSAAESGRDVLILCLSLAGAKAAFRGFRDRARKADARCNDVLMEVVFGNCGRIRFALASDSLRAVSPDVIVLDGLEGALSVVARANEVIGRERRDGHGFCFMYRDHRHCDEYCSDGAEAMHEPDMDR